MTRPRVRTILIVGLFVLTWSLSPGLWAQSPLAPSYAASEPGISPDGQEISFASGGDIWTVPANGGQARLLVSHDATERRPLYSPDGQHLAFMSTRTGGGDIYILTFASGALRRLTSDDGAEVLEGWSPDGAWVYFASTSRDIAGMNDIFRVPATGGTPMAVSDDRYVNEFGVAATPDGASLVLAARGISGAQWWRKGSSHIDQSELWLLTGLSGTTKYTPLSARDSRQIWPMVSRDGRALYYVSDRGGAENVWRRDLPGDADPETEAARGRKLTTFTSGRLLFPSLSADGRTISFERDFGLWTLDTSSGAARQVPVTFRGASATPVPQRLRQTNGFSGLALSPDGRKVAFVTRGILFAASAKDPGDATRVTAEAGLVSQPAWSPDSRRLVYVAARGGTQNIYQYDFTTSTESRKTTGAAVDISPVFSPDGTHVAFVRDRKQLRVLTLSDNTERALATGMFGDAIDTPLPVWAPSGRWIALFTIGSKSFTNVSLVPTGAPGGPPRPISTLSNVYANTIAWTPDGQTVFFDTRQRTEQGQLARVDLTLRTPKFREDLFRDLFIQNPRPTPAPTPTPTGAPTPPVPVCATHRR